MAEAAKQHSLLWKLIAINVAMIAAVILVVWLAVDFLAADYFSILMKDYNIDPADSHKMFVDSIHRYLIQVSIFALALALLFSFLLTFSSLFASGLVSFVPVKLRLLVSCFAVRTLFRTFRWRCGGLLGHDARAGRWVKSRRTRKVERRRRCVLSHNARRHDSARIHDNRHSHRDSARHHASGRVRHPLGNRTRYLHLA